jgi:hypothetical protein
MGTARSMRRPVRRTPAHTGGGCALGADPPERVPGTGHGDVGGDLAAHGARLGVSAFVADRLGRRRGHLALGNLDVYIR